MKHNTLEWVIFTLKSVVSALFFVFAFYGAMSLWLLTQQTTINQAALAGIWTQHTLATVIVGLVALGGWLMSVRYFHTQLQLTTLTQAVNELGMQVKNAKDMDENPAVNELRLGRRLRPMAKSVDDLYTAAQNAMEEERDIERSKDEMITNVSHDLRTPLTSILGYLGLIVNDSPQELTVEDAKQYATTAFSKAQQMKSLVEDLFDYTQVKQVDFKLRWAPLDLAALLQQLSASYELEAKQKDVVISAVTNPKRIEMIGDPDQLARVFMNLISNALKYGKNATFIRLSAKIIEDENVVEVRVTNNGDPIPEDSIDRLFDRFYRVESSRNTGTGGTGLGLAIVSSVVEAHGGTIEVTSNPELTSFIIRLPLQEAE
ncbi:HAMP domain-containing histidine kinase [Weissella viridescens]|nr:HAMP domain-containing sensor histidine kinase [Weissella viridescens]MBX4173141.1 HAMP domain-containing histidine kinase [Weissella viridescens]